MPRFVAILTLLATLTLPAPPAAGTAPSLRAHTIQSGLDYPWDVAFIDGRMLVTERPGRIRVYAHGGRGAALLSTEHVANVRAEGEAGVMGIAAARRNGRNYVFVCASRQVKAGWRNQVLRYRLSSAGRLHEDRVVLGGMRASYIHNGCAVEVGPDRNLWVSMGDANDLSLPQNRQSRNGKILRVKLGGGIPDSNPFRGSPVYAMGLRNPQGIAFYPGTSRAYSIEHGPDVHDEINRLRPGRNYGWPFWTGWTTRGPRSTGCATASAYKTPAWSSGSGGTLATSNGAFVSGAEWGSWRNDLFVATLKEQDVRRLDLNDAGSRAYARSPVLYDGRWGRLRAMVRGPRRTLFISTSNGDGSDRIIRLKPAQ